MWNLFSLCAVVGVGLHLLVLVAGAGLAIVMVRRRGWPAVLVGLACGWGLLGAGGALLATVGMTTYLGATGRPLGVDHWAYEAWTAATPVAEGLTIGITLALIALATGAFAWRAR